MKSFSQTVKEEIAAHFASGKRATALLGGMLLFGRKIKNGRIAFWTENEAVSALFETLVRKITEEPVSVQQTASGQFVHKIAGQAAQKLLDKLGIRQESDGIPAKAQAGKAAAAAFAAGAFLAAGSVSDPNKDYHLEFSARSPQLAAEFSALLQTHWGIIVKTAQRRSGEMLYVKESEQIEDLLTMMGAQNAALEIMNVKIFKDVRNKINRAVNCDNANIEKTLRAAERQLEDIDLIEKTCGLDSIPEDLKEIAQIRSEFPEYNLKELGQALSTPISRSGANHRMERIAKIAADFRAKKQKNGKI